MARLLAAAAIVLLATGAAQAGTFFGRYPAVGADSPSACAELDREEAVRRAREPITEMDVYRSMGDAIASIALMKLAMLAPTLGVHARRGSSGLGLAISWPGSIPLGPVTACRRSFSGDLRPFRPLRIVLEPGVIVRSPVSIFVRPGLRAVWHRSTSRLGVGAGIGSTLAWIHGHGGAASISPELLLHFGRCCGPGYLLLSVRADRYPSQSEPDSAVATLGIAYF